MALREYLPLEQGLRPSFQSLLVTSVTMLREYLPLEQGLRLCWKLICINHLYLREYLPLEQGLRHSS